MPAAPSSGALRHLLPDGEKVERAEFEGRQTLPVSCADISPTRGDGVRGFGGHPTPARSADPPPRGEGVRGEVSLAGAAGLAFGFLLALEIAGILVGTGAGFGADEGFCGVGLFRLAFQQRREAISGLRHRLFRQGAAGVERLFGAADGHFVEAVLAKIAWSLFWLGPAFLSVCAGQGVRAAVLAEQAGLLARGGGDVAAHFVEVRLAESGLPLGRFAGRAGHVGAWAHVVERGFGEEGMAGLISPLVGEMARRVRGGYGGGFGG